MAQEGIREMQFLLGFLKEAGLGYTKNIPEADQWYRRAAENGFAAAQYMLYYANRPNPARLARHRHCSPRSQFAVS
jgi:TPR repeat protein